MQDEASQLAALLSGAAPGQQVLDLCAGAGGKTLALAAMLAGKGQVYATDDDGRRLAPIYARLERSGARNVQVRSPRGGADPVADLVGRCDLVLVDAPCTGSGAWRRNPDAKWRMRPGALEQRIKDQKEILSERRNYVKPGGRLVYITCSVLKAENEARVDEFLQAHDEFLPLDAATMATRRRPAGAGRFRLQTGAGAAARPAAHGDGRVLCRGSAQGRLAQKA